MHSSKFLRSFFENYTDIAILFIIVRYNGFLLLVKYGELSDRFSNEDNLTFTTYLYLQLYSILNFEFYFIVLLAVMFSIKTEVFILSVC